MKAINILLITASVLALQVSQLSAQSFSIKSYKLTVKGSSSLHDWESSVEKLEGSGAFVLENNALVDIKHAVVKIPVKAIKSTKGRMMDQKTYDAFDADKNPTIIFVLQSKKIDAAKNTLVASGALTMAGVTKPVELNLSYKILPDGALRITGSKKLTMSEFKMEPPTAMMGTIKVGDQIEVTIDLTLTLDSASL